MTARPAATPASPSLWNGEFIRMIVVNLCMYIPIFMLNTGLAAYVTSLHGGAEIAGLSTGVFSITAFLGYLVAGRALDTGNRRNILAGSLVVMAVAIAGYAAFGTVFAVIAFRLLQGFGLAFATTSFLVVVTQTLPKEKLSIGIRYFTMVMVVGQAIGPSLGIDLVGWIGYRGLFVVDAAFMLVGAAIVLTVKSGGRAALQKTVTKFGNPFAREAIPGGILLFLTTIAFFVVSSFLVVYAKGQGVDAGIGYFFTIYAVTLLVVNPLVSRLMRHVGTVPILVSAFVLQALSLAVLSISATLPMFYLSAVLMAAGYGVSMPLIKALTMDSVPAERYGAASSTSNLGVDLGTLAGGLVGGGIVEAVGYSSMWEVMAAPVILAAVVVVILRRGFGRAAAAERTPPRAPIPQHESAGRQA